MTQTIRDPLILNAEEAVVLFTAIGDFVASAKYAIDTDVILNQFGGEANDWAIQSIVKYEDLYEKVTHYLESNGMPLARVMKMVSENPPEPKKNV